MPVYQVEKYYWKCPLCKIEGGTYDSEDAARRALVMVHGPVCSGYRDN